MLTIHHLGVSQSERILWLCEELSLPYNLIKHVRDPLLSPTTLKTIPGNETGKAPFIVDPDADVTLSESGAIVEYITTKHGGGRLAIPPAHPSYAQYLHWMHFANGTLQTLMICCMFVDMADGVAPTDPAKQFADARLDGACRVLDDRLASNKWLVGEVFTAADVMTVYCLTTQRYWGPRWSLAPYPHVLRWLRDCTARPAYVRAMEKGDPEMRVLSGPDPPAVTMSAAGGVKSDHWKK